jgi:hypothetical protein
MSSFRCCNIQHNDIQLNDSQDYVSQHNDIQLNNSHQTEYIATLCITFLVYHELLFSHAEHHHAGPCAECCSAVSLGADFHHVKVHFVER